VLTLAGRLAIAQTSSNGDFKLALPEHKGQLRFVANGFKIVENSATPNGRELGIRARNDSAGISFLGFIFLVPGASPLTSAKCRDGALAQETKSDPALKLLKTSKIARSARLPVCAGHVHVPRPRVQGSWLRRDSRYLRRFGALQ
jgi:hypothetical protein